MKILVADDSSTVRRLVAARLAADGYEVIEAEKHRRRKEPGGHLGLLR